MDPIKKIIEEANNLRDKNRSEKEEKERRAREEYENHPDTIMQNEMRELLPIIIRTLENFSKSANAMCINYYDPPQYPPPKDILALYQIYTKKGLIFKKHDSLIARVLIGIRADYVDGVNDKIRYVNSCRLAIVNYPERIEFKTLPEKDKLEEWLVRELAKFYAKFGIK